MANRTVPLIVAASAVVTGRQTGWSSELFVHVGLIQASGAVAWADGTPAKERGVYCSVQSSVVLVLCSISIENFELWWKGVGATKSQTIEAEEESLREDGTFKTTMKYTGWHQNDFNIQG